MVPLGPITGRRLGLGSADRVATELDEEDEDAEGSPTELRKILTSLSKATKRRGKEAEAVKLPSLPTNPQFRAWRLTVRAKVVAASGRGQECFTWMLQVEKTGATQESLSDPGRSFVSLDSKLAAAISEIVSGELGRKITL